MARTIIDTTPGAGDTGKGGGDKLNDMTGELFNGVPSIPAYNTLSPKGAKRLLGTVRAGVARRVITIAGDSIGTFNGTETFAWPRQLRRQFETAGFTCRSDFWMFGLMPNYTTYPNVTFGAGWSTAFGMVQSSGTTTTTITPEKPFDTVKLAWLNNGTGLTFEIQIGTDTPVVVTSVAGQSAKMQTVTGTAGSTSWTIKATTGSGLFHSAETFSSTVKDLGIRNMSFPGTALYDWVNQSGFSNGAWMALYSHDYVVMALGVNDLANGQTLAQWSANLATWATQYPTIQSLYVGHHAISPNGSIQQSFHDATKASALGRNFPFVSMWERWGTSYAVVNAAGWVSDGLHPDPPGSYDWSVAISRALLS